jgi:hypothetical protein
MGNRFGASASGPGLSLSNGGSEVFLDVLALAACDLVESRFERGFALLLCNSRIGLGNESFDLDELPWSGEWETERAFLLRVIGLAQTHFRWDLLGYEPPYADRYLADYANLVRDYRPVEHGELTRLWDQAPAEAAFSRCPEHGLFLGDYTDCRLCVT